MDAASGCAADPDGAVRIGGDLNRSGAAHARAQGDSAGGGRGAGGGEPLPDRGVHAAAYLVLGHADAGGRRCASQRRARTRRGQAPIAPTIAVGMATGAGDRHGEGIELYNLGLALREVRRFDEATIAYHDAAAIFRSTKDEHNECLARENLQAVRAAQQS